MRVGEQNKQAVSPGQILLKDLSSWKADAIMCGEEHSGGLK